MRLNGLLNFKAAVAANIALATTVPIGPNKIARAMIGTADVERDVFLTYRLIENHSVMQIVIAIAANPTQSEDE
jgi:hypothetical protein